MQNLSCNLQRNVFWDTSSNKNPPASVTRPLKQVYASSTLLHRPLVPGLFEQILHHLRYHIQEMYKS